MLISWLRASCEMLPFFKISISALNSFCKFRTPTEAFSASKSIPNKAFETLPAISINAFKGFATKLIIAKPNLVAITLSRSKDSPTLLAFAFMSLFCSTIFVRPWKSPRIMSRPTDNFSKVWPSFLVALP